MKRIFLLFLFVLVSFTGVYAGDVANFVNLGFSQDGKTFAFGQYGLTDKNFRAYADIFIVDIEKNDFINNGVFHTTPTKATENKESKSVFLSLQNRAAPYLSKADISEKRPGRPIYAQTERTKNDTTLIFRDFETSNEYNVVLTKKIDGLKGAFYITVEITHTDGSIQKKKVGNPGYYRKGVKDYSIKQILINENNNGLVFVIEKTVNDPTGTSIRYMIETIKL